MKRDVDGLGIITTTDDVEEEEEEEGKGDSIVRRGLGFDMSNTPDLSLYNRWTLEMTNLLQALENTVFLVCCCVFAQKQQFYQSGPLQLFNRRPATH